MTPELQKKLQLQGLDKRGRSPFFQGRRKDVSGGNYSQHVCYLCGRWRDCEMEKCTHAVCVRILPCCDPKKRDEEKVKW